MHVLGVETSCDETSVAVVEKQKVLSNIIFSSLKYHAPFGGVIPEIASRQHLKSIETCFDFSLKEAGITPEQIDLIAVTLNPGLVGSLLVGINFARALSYSLNKPLIEINHLHAHLFAAFLNKQEKIEFPFLGLVVSGGHTELYDVKDFDKITVIGKTRDDACGEALDKIGRLYGLGYPAGPIIDKMFDINLVDKKAFEIKGLKDSFDFSFSGIKTKAAYIYRDLLKNGQAKDKETIKKIISSFQFSVISHIIERVQGVMATKKYKSLVCGGGVAANSFLRTNLELVCKNRNIPLNLSEIKYCADNAAAVAGLGFYMYNTLNIKPVFN